MKPLVDVFGVTVTQHAQEFDYLSPSPNCIAQKGDISEPLKYTLTVLQPESISILKSIYSQQYPEYRTVLYTLTLPSTARKFTWYVRLTTGCQCNDNLVL